jgi:putative transposase
MFGLSIVFAMKRTISIKLKLSEEQSQALLHLQTEFVLACQQIAEIACTAEEFQRIRLHHLSYYPTREAHPELGAQMICNAIARVSQSLRSIKKLQKLVFKEKTAVHFDKRTYTLKGDLLSLFTLQGRIQIPLEISAFHRSYLDIGLPKEAELIRKGKRWFFNLVLDLPEVPLNAGEKILAVDFGENNLAATSTGKLMGGGVLRAQRDQFLAHRRRLQSNGSQSARQRLRQISGRERRHVTHVNHCVAKTIVAEAVAHGCGSIALENLKNIRKRIRAGKKVRSRLHRWAFDQLRQFVEYKAAAQGIQVTYLCPAYTSQICSSCLALGSRHKHRFTCSHCGSFQHSDFNASRNLLRLATSADVANGAVNRRHVAA